MMPTSRYLSSGVMWMPAGVGPTGTFQMGCWVLRSMARTSVGVLQGDEDELAGLVEGHVGRRFCGGHAGHQRVVWRPGRGRPGRGAANWPRTTCCPARSRAGRVGDVLDALLFFASCGIEEHQFVRDGTRDDHRVCRRAWRSDGEVPCRPGARPVSFVGPGVDEADVLVHRIEDDGSFSLGGGDR